VSVGTFAARNGSVTGAARCAEILERKAANAMPRHSKHRPSPGADTDIVKKTNSPSQSGSGERADTLGVRRSIELPDVDISAADPTAGSVPAAGSSAPASGGEAAAGVEEQAAEAKEAKEEAEAVPAVATAAATDSEPGNGGMPPGWPRKPVLAAAAIGGVILLAIPILLIGTGSHHHEKHRTDAAGNALLPNDAQQPPGTFVSASPTATPSASASASPSTKTKPAASKKPKTKATAGSKGPAKKGSAGSSTGRAKTMSVPSGERPKSGGDPYALEVHSALDLHPGDTWRTNVIALTMERGGNLVLRNKSGKAIWSSGTHRSGVYCEFQTDGNLVIYAGQRTAVWASGTYGHPNATLVLQADSNMVIFDGHNAIWATGT
jgi:hypothetical protein